MENEDRDVKLAGATENAPEAGQGAGAAGAGGDVLKAGATSAIAAGAPTGDTASAASADAIGGAASDAAPGDSTAPVDLAPGADEATTQSGAPEVLSAAPSSDAPLADEPEALSAAAASVATVTTEAAAKATTRSASSELFAWVRDIAIAILIAFVITRFVTPTIVQEHSMQDTLDNHDYLFMYKMAYKFGGEPEYGDIVVFRSDILAEDGSKKLLIKRVIAVGGDTVAVKDGIVYRNGEALDEPYTKDGYTTGAMDETVVPEGTLFLLGDNREVSVDSRSPEVGFVSENRLVGKAIFRLFPFNKIGGIYDNYSGN